MRSLVLLLLLSATPVRAEYVVERGDVLTVSVAEDSELGREAKVDTEGRIALPRLGSVEAAGSGLDAIRDRITRDLEQRDIIRSPTVLVEVAHYRPFYVGGAVEAPGAVAYEPGLTVRQAILLAGGVAIGREAAGGSTTDLLDLRARVRTNAYALLQARSRIARLQAELARTPAKELPPVDGSLVAGDAAAEIAAIDNGLLSDRLQVLAADDTHFKDLLSLIDFELDVLGKQAGYQESEQAMQQKEIENARSLFEQGLIPLPRLQELEREGSHMSRDLLENQAFAARARQSQVTARYELDAAETNWRIEVRQELAAALLERTRLEAETDVLSGAALSAGIALGEQARTAPPVLRVSIHRAVDGRSETIEAQPETEIVPGDVLEVSLEAAANG